MMFAALRTLFLFLLALCVLAPLAQSARAGTLTDDRGVALRFEQPPRRIVSLLPSLTETVCALEACDRLVGIDDFSNWPVSVRTLPHVGGLDDANVERIVALRPDVVLLGSSARVIERLEALGIRVAALEPKSLGDMEHVLGKVGQLLGREAQAAAMWRDTQAGLTRVAAELPPHLRGTRVYFEVNTGPYAASESSFIGETLARLGVANIVPASLGPFPKLNPEFVVRADPRLIMTDERNAIGLEDRPGWGRIDAVRHGRICRFTSAERDVLVRPGPRMVEAAQLMARCLKDRLG